MKRVSFTDIEIKCLEKMAGWRDKGKQNLKSTVRMASTTYEGHLMGICGEYAVGKLMGGFFDPMLRKAGDKHSADIIVGKDLRVAVKTTKYSPPIFKISKYREINDATHVALCLYLVDAIEVHWIMPVESFKKGAYTRDFGWGNRLCMDSTPPSSIKVQRG